MFGISLRRLMKPMPITEITSSRDLHYAMTFFPEQKDDLRKQLLTDAAFFSKVVESCWDVSYLVNIFPQSKNELTVRVFSDTVLLEKFINDFSAFKKMISLFPLKKNELCEFIMRHAAIFNAVISDTYKFCHVLVIFPQYERKICYTYAIFKLGKAVENADLPRINFITSILQDKSIVTNDDRVLRNRLMKLVNDELEKTDGIDNLITNSLQGLRLVVAKIPAPSLLAITSLFVRENEILNENNKKELPADLIESLVYSSV